MSDGADVNLLTRIAHMYYDEGMTQQTIAKKLSISRSLVSKLLTRAREMGIVTITIREEVRRPFQDMEEYLKRALGLHAVILVSGEEGGSRREVAAEAGRYLTMRMDEVSKVAVASGRTVMEIASSLPVTKAYFHVTFVPMYGGLSAESAKIEANSVSETFALKFGAKTMRLHAPILVDSEESREVLMKQYFIRNVLDAARTADLALVGIGSTFRYAENKEAYLHGYSEDDIRDSKSIKGDLAYNYFDKNGNLFDCKWNRLLIGLSLEEIRQIPEVICAAAEAEKAESIYIAAKHGLVNTLIASEAIAQKLLWYHRREYHIE